MAAVFTHRMHNASIRGGSAAYHIGPLTTTVADRQLESFLPETFRLPKAGQRDPHFGLSRSHYYKLEKEGAIRLHRIRKRGNMRGITLVPYDQVPKFITSCGREETTHGLN